MSAANRTEQVFVGLERLHLEIRKVNVVVGGDLVPFKMGRILHKTTDVQVSPRIASCPPFEEKGAQLTL